MLKAYWHYIKRYPMAYWLVVIGVFVDFLVWVVPARVTQAIIDAMSTNTLTVSGLTFLILCLIGTAAVMYSAQFMWVTLLYGRMAHFIRELKQGMYEKMLNMRIQFFEKFRSGDMMTRFTSDIQSIEDFIGYGAMTFLISVGTLIIIVPMMLSISWSITLIAMLPTLLAIVPITLLTQRQDDAVEAQREAVSALSNEVLEVVEGIRVIRAYGNKAEAQDRFQAKTRQLANKADKIMYYQAAMGRSMMAIISLSTALIIGLGGMELAAGRISLGQIVALQIYSGSLAELLWSFTDLIVVYQAANISYDKVAELMAEGDDLEPAGSRALDGLDQIELVDYSFRYQGAAEDSLKQIHLRLKKGQTLGIVGKTGSGKTTLARQFLRQYPVGQGEFLVNSEPVTVYRPHDVEALVGYVPQEHLLFSRSVRENILLGRPEASQKEVDVAVAIAAFTQDLERMADGYDTLIGEKGVSISGGQKQRISIARAMLKDPELLILDDALSAVDARTERIIIDNIQTLRAGKTTLITTHRLSAVEHADWILVLDQGRIVEEGRSADLMALGGWYAEQAWRQRLAEQSEDDTGEEAGIGLASPSTLDAHAREEEVK